MARRTNRSAWWRMERRLNADNFEEWFGRTERFFALRPDGPYLDEALRVQHHEAFLHIKQLTKQGGEQDVRELVRYLRPWDVWAEGYSGRDHLQWIAKQALCHLGQEKPSVPQQLEMIAASDAAEWREFDEKDIRCLSILPHQYFVENLHLVLECIDGRPRIHRPWWQHVMAKIFP